MRVINDIKDIRVRWASVTAIGVFDGVHKAHRRIIKAAIVRARSLGVKAAVVTFWPHPRGQESLYSLGHRLRILEELGVDLCVVIKFDSNFARIGPEVFVEDILCRRLKAAAVYVGENFRFGKNASGDVSTLRRLLKPHHAQVKSFKTLKTGGIAISSSYIRKLILRGELGLARRLLLRHVAVYGDVVRGTGRGTGLGFPTANIDPHHEITPPAGIYAVRVFWGSQSSGGICYIGTRPTYGRCCKDRVIEVHIFNFRRNLYGDHIEAQFIKKIRDQKKFSSEAALARQISLDIEKARAFLK